MLNNWLQHIEFAYPWAFSLLLLLPILIYEYFIRQRSSSASMLVTTTHFIKDVKTYRTYLRHVPFYLRCFGLLFLIIAFARPQYRFNEQETKGEGIDIVLCFDISGSMVEKDIPPNRLEAAKEVAAQFVEQRLGDRIGIVIFTSQSFTLCPVTIDHNTVLSQIKNIQGGYLTETGTAIGSGLATSIDRLRTSAAKSKIIILLTDGVDFGGEIPPDIAKDMAKLYGVKIYSIGIGSEKEIEEVTNTALGPVKQKKKLEYNEGLLQELAQETGGQYFQATDKEALQKIYVSINQLEKSKVEVKTYDKYTDEYFPWLLIGLSLLLFEAILRYTLFRKFP